IRPRQGPAPVGPLAGHPKEVGAIGRADPSLARIAEADGLWVRRPAQLPPGHPAVVGDDQPRPLVWHQPSMDLLRVGPAGNPPTRRGADEMHRPNRCLGLTMLSPRTPAIGGTEQR